MSSQPVTTTPSLASLFGEESMAPKRDAGPLPGAVMRADQFESSLRMAEMSASKGIERSRPAAEQRRLDHLDRTDSQARTSHRPRPDSAQDQRHANNDSRRNVERRLDQRDADARIADARDRGRDAERVERDRSSAASDEASDGANDAMARDLVNDAQQAAGSADTANDRRDDGADPQVDEADAVVADGGEDLTTGNDLAGADGEAATGSGAEQADELGGIDDSVEQTTGDEDEPLVDANAEFAAAVAASASDAAATPNHDASSGAEPALADDGAEPVAGAVGEQPPGAATDRAADGNAVLAPGSGTGGPAGQTQQDSGRQEQARPDAEAGAVGAVDETGAGPDGESSAATTGSQPSTTDTPAGDEGTTNDQGSVVDNTAPQESANTAVSAPTSVAARSASSESSPGLAGPSGDGQPVAAVTGAGQVGRAEQATARPVDAPAEASLPGAVEDADGTDPLWRQVRRALGSVRANAEGDQELTIRLRPADMGSVMVRISTGDSGTAVALVADSAVAANQLQQQRQQLIGELEDSGIRGVAVDVNTSGQGQTRPDLGAEADGRRPPRGGFTPGALSEAASRLDPNSAGRDRRVRTPSSGLVDLDL